MSSPAAHGWVNFFPKPLAIAFTRLNRMYSSSAHPPEMIAYQLRGCRSGPIIGTDLSTASRRPMGADSRLPTIREESNSIRLRGNGQ